MTDEEPTIRHKVEGKRVEKYGTHLTEKSRPPSKGGNTRAMHQHFLTIDGVTYSFWAMGARQWVFASDTVSFEWVQNNGYKNIVDGTLVTLDKSGKPVVRGLRGSKPFLRTASARLPGSRREQRD